MGGGCWDHVTHVTRLLLLPTSENKMSLTWMLSRWQMWRHRCDVTLMLRHCVTSRDNFWKWNVVDVHGRCVDGIVDVLMLTCWCWCVDGIVGVLTWRWWWLQLLLRLLSRLQCCCCCLWCCLCSISQLLMLLLFQLLNLTTTKKRICLERAMGRRVVCSVISLAFLSLIHSPNGRRLFHHHPFLHSSR